MKASPPTLPLSTDQLRARDAEARQAAQTIFDHPLVIEAGAGTGKTRTLVARVVVWCMGPGWARATSAPGLADATIERVATRVLQRVVAITFTEAAAAEMAERIAESFGQIARDEEVVGLDATLLPADLDERRARARALMAALDHLVVRTIHAFCRRLLSAHPIEAGIHPEFQVDAEGLLQAEVIRDVIEAHLRDAYAEPGDPGFLALAEHSKGPQEIDAALKVLVQSGANPKDFDIDPFAGDVTEGLIAGLSTQLERFQEIEGQRLRDLKGLKRTESVLQSVAAFQARIEANPGKLVGVARLQALIDSIVELWPGENVDRLHEWGKGKFGVKESAALGDRCALLAPCCADLRGSVQHLASLDPDLLNLGRRVLRPLLAEVYAQLRTRGIATFAALLRDALHLLDNSPDVAERVRDGIDQLLVDEFQDTDAIQCGIVRILALSGSPARRPGLFIVGDPKQSIYGWRNADLRAYDGFVHEVRTQGGELHHLSVNFRSVPSILDEVERVTAPVMEARAGIQPAFQPLVACDRLAGVDGFDAGDCAPVEYWVSWEDTAQPPKTLTAAANRVEATALAQDIRRLHVQHHVVWSDVAVLLRSTSDIEVYLGALRDAAIPFVVERDRSYYQRREVIEAWALIECMLEPADHVALLTFLRSALVGVPDAALIPLWTHDFPKLMTELMRPDAAQLADLGRAIAAAVGEVPGDIPGIERVRGWEHNLRVAVRRLAELREAFHDDPADLILEKLRTTLLPEATEAARYLGRYRLANLERFFSRLLMALETVGGDAHAVLRALRLSIGEAQEAEEARPKDAGEDAVLVSTIHQAKGLDFGHVYLMQLHKESQSERKSENDAMEIQGRLEYRLFGAPTPGFAAVERQRREVEAAERVRTLYVAITRAKQRLVLAGSWPAGGTPGPAAAARRHVDLLGHRDLPPPDLGALWRTLSGSGVARADAAQARWVFPALESRSEEPSGAAMDGAVASSMRPSAVAATSARLRLLHGEAEKRAQRAYSGPLSEEAHKGLQDLLSQRFDASARSMVASVAGDAAQRVALAAGTAVHRILEVFDLDHDPDAEMQMQMERLDAHLPPLADAERAQAVARAESTLRCFRAGPLWAKFVALRAHIVARELPVLLPPAVDSGPVGFVGGAIDLVCRDPSDGRPFIVDYKTDVVADEDDLQARARVYASQGALYARALQEALALAHLPRFELWFLNAGVVR